MSYPESVKKKAFEMRRNGASIIDIAKEIGLAKSTVSLWVRDVELPKNILKHLKNNSEKGCALGRMVMAARKRTESQINRSEAEEFINKTLKKADRDFWRLVVVLLYWCEGAKEPASNFFFVNSDPAMIKTYLKALRLGWEIDETRFKISLHLHEYHDIRQQVIFWSRVTGIPTTQFIKPYIKPHTGKQKRLGYPGCVSIRYRDVGLAKKVKALYHAFAIK